MPYVIISTVAIFANVYKNAPLIVGDKDSDPDLMRFLGARLTTNYPACGSPPMYVLHAPPRTVFDNLEKRGYCLMSAQTIQEHSVWILARPRVPDDDKVEISRGGPNDKSIQAFDESQDSNSNSPSRATSIGRPRSPTETPRIKISRSSSRQEEDKALEPSEPTRITTTEQSSPRQEEDNFSEIPGSPTSQKSFQIDNQTIYSGSQKQPSQDDDTRSTSTDLNRRDESPNNVLFSVQFRESSPRRKSSHRSKKLLESQKLSVEIIENEPKRRSSHRPRRMLEYGNPRSQSVSPDKRGTRDTSPKSQSLTFQNPESSSRRKSSQRDNRSFIPNNLRLSVQVRENSPRRKNVCVKEKMSIGTETTRSRSKSPEKRHTSPSEPHKLRDSILLAQKRNLPQKERSWTRICTENDHTYFRSASPARGFITALEDSQKILPCDKEDPGNVTSRGDAGTHWLGSEKVHMGVQASDSEVSLTKGSDIMSRVIFDPRKHSELLKNSDESIENHLQIETPKKKSALKRTISSSQQTQAEFDCLELIKPRKTGISVHFARSNEGDIEKSSTLSSCIPEISGFIDFTCLGCNKTEKHPTTSGNDQGNNFRNFEESSKMNDALKNSVILRSLASRCSHIAIVDEANKPMFIDIRDPNNLTCLTHENCCCEDS
ncbi:unnamed protein product [Nezara viridula]|uniref:GTP cyclohydrolase 1 feedback regulatory protein n=1 Tax=Nezara viridula TaxID=85310 RepID=A0A9P0MQC7_NEZVI|nr:unnamed protein product [Nezara viridula]